MDCKEVKPIKARRRCSRCYSRLYRAEHPEATERARVRGRERMAQWVRDNPERHRENARRYRTENPDKCRESTRKYLAKLSPEQRRAIWIKSKYKLTDEQYAELLARPNECAACAVSFDEDGVRRHIDHDHATGAFRGLLCGPCNQAAGLLRDSPKRAVQLAAYLRKVSRRSRRAA